MAAMIPNEICRDYRLAKNKREQIKILADLNCTSTEEIEKVLVDCGEMAQPKPKKKPAKRTESEPVKMPELSDAVADVLFQRMDELDKLIKPLEDELKPLRNEYTEIATFLKRCGREKIYE